DAPTAQPQPCAAGGAGWDGQGHRTLDGRHRNLGAQRRFADRDRQVELDVSAVAAEMRIRLYVDVEVEVARHSVLLGRRRTLAGNAQPPTRLDARRNLHIDL